MKPILIGLILICILPLHSVLGQLQRFSYSHSQMGTEFRIILYANSESAAAKASQVAFSRIDELNLRLSNYISNSEVNRLSSEAGNYVPLPISKDLWQVLIASQNISSKSDGAFDITIGPLSKLWRRAFRREAFPEKEAIVQASSRVNYQYLRVDSIRQTACLLKANMQIDLGAIGKGFAVDEAIAVLKLHGIRHALVDGGGDIRVIGKPPAQEGWRIKVATLKNDGTLSDTIVFLAGDVALATSGDSYRYLDWKGKRYSHIIDPRTGLGINNRKHVTVTASNCMLADALASTISILDPQQALSFLDKFKEASAQIFIQQENRYSQFGKLIINNNE